MMKSGKQQPRRWSRALKWALPGLLALGTPGCSADVAGATPVAQAPGPAVLVAGPEELIFSVTRDGRSAPRTITLRNDGARDLVVRALRVDGAQAGAFELLSPPTAPFTVAPGARVQFDVRFVPGGAVGLLNATVRAEVEGGDGRAVGVYGLSTLGEQGDAEPPLHDVVRALGYAIDVGGSGLILGTGAAPIGEEVLGGLFERAAEGPVTLRPVARYSPDDLLPFGYYPAPVGGAVPTRTPVGVVARRQEQTLLPALESGGTSFDPGTAPFGVFAGPTSYGPDVGYTQDALNTGPTRHAVRIYPLRDRSGRPVANAFLLAFEPAQNGDYNDYVFVLHNARLVPTTRP